MLKRKFKNYSPKIKEECGVFGISNYEDASALVALGLHALQHRGQEGCGIVSFDEKKYYSEKRYGLVGDNFNKQKVYPMGHFRMSDSKVSVGNTIQESRLLALSQKCQILIRVCFPGDSGD